MIEEELRKLNKVLEDNGFDIKSEISENVFYIMPKDEWKGVEFVCILFNNQIKPISHIDNKWIHTKRNTSVRKSESIPSTEEAYVNQLIKNVKERFGDIRDGDRFKREWKEDLEGRTEFVIGDRKYTFKGFKYYIGSDILRYDGYIIYEGGKWAQKVEQPKVDFITSKSVSDTRSNGKFIGGEYNFTFKLNNVEHKNLHHIGEHLAKQIENYLKNEDNN